MANPIITVNVTSGTTAPLLISDDEGHSSTTAAGDTNLTTTVDQNDLVTWNIEPGSTITSIRIVEKEGSENLFDPDPTGNADNTIWTGTIGSKASKTVESYTIFYTIGGTEYSQDPRLQMN
ncbi:MAG: hypothetical protein HKP39_12375 [Eudoraea sp.]|nr:hypothetical protein [Maribacter sp.]NNL03062.1 hypothetical protein [Eudoraea sp.]